MKGDISIINSDNDLAIGIRIYNPKKYDLINKRQIKATAVFELILSNTTSRDITVSNPSLIIYTSSIFKTKSKRFVSSELALKSPFTILAGSQMNIFYEAEQLSTLLQEEIKELMSFQIYNVTGFTYSTYQLNGDAIERIIDEETTYSALNSETLYSFDLEVDI